MIKKRWQMRYIITHMIVNLSILFKVDKHSRAKVFMRHMITSGFIYPHPIPKENHRSVVKVDVE